MDYLDQQTTPETFFESDPVPAVDTGTDRRKTRWAVFCGDDMSDIFKKQFKGAQIGGMYFGHDLKTLHLTKQMMRRCELTPFVLGYDWLNTDSLGGDTTKAKSFNRFNEHTRQMETRYAYECLPGDELESVLSAMQGPFDIGIREIPSLLDEAAPEPIKSTEGRITGYTQSKGKQMQLAIFPEWNSYVSGEKEFFPTISALREYLLSRHDQVPVDVKEIIEVLMESNDQFEVWATDRLSEKGVLVKSPVGQDGRAYSWNKDDFRRFSQTGLNREEFLMKKVETPEPVNTEAADDKMARLEKMFATLMEDKIEQKMVEKAEAPRLEAPSSVAPSEERVDQFFASNKRVTVDEKPGTVGEKKGGGYYAVKFDDGTEGNFRPTQMKVSIIEE